MDSTQLRCFVTLSEQMNFTRAAKACGITQPALSKAIRRLEGEFGGELFYREGKLTHLSELGRLVQPYLLQMENAAAAARTSAREHNLGRAAMVRVGVGSGVRLASLARAIVDVERNFQFTSVELKEGADEALIDAVIAGELDTALVCEREVWPDRVCFSTLYSEHFVLACSRDHGLGGEGDSVDERLLSDEDLIVLDGCTYMAEFKTLCNQLGTQIRMRYHCHNYNHIGQLVAANLGVAVVPARTFVPPAVRLRTFSRFAATREIGVVVLAGRRRSSALDAFIRVLRVVDRQEREHGDFLRET